MTGFYVYFNDDAMEEVAHMQAWTLGIGETVSKYLSFYSNRLTSIPCFYRLDSVRGSIESHIRHKLTFDF